ncbi:MAG TPA: alpha/beta hydrolase-fold protein, partial [Terriglobales bacterium]|nr:alpha/beta hydrolase-fold protein [Terriglobales bacterium]
MKTTSAGLLVLIMATCAAAWGQVGAVEEASCAAQQGSKPAKFEVSFPAAAHAAPITGRVFVILARSTEPDPRMQIGSWTERTPYFGEDVSQLKAGDAAVLGADPGTLGFPFKSLCGVAAGDYYVEGLMNVYTEFYRSDGHTVWAHMDEWEGQQFNRSPGNLYSDVQKVHLDPQAGFDLKLSLTHVIPPIQMPPDTAQVKHIKIQSQLLTKFWGHAMYVGATVLLPRGYEDHPNVRYPVIYIQDHFTLRAPFGFSTQPSEHDAEIEPYLQSVGVTHWVDGYQFQQIWNSPDFPRMIAVTFQHPTPYFDDSYAVNSANDGPYGDALLKELVPYLEQHFRMSRQPYERVLTGGSTGGWESLALQLYHPKFFGGTWTFYPDPIDFSRYQLVNIYKDDNAFLVPGFEPPVPERPLERTVEGQVTFTNREMSLMEEVLGTHGRSGQQLEAWEAVYGPVGEDGYPKPLWNKLSGEIDHGVADYMRDHGYDLRYYLEQNWPKIGPDLVGKIHIYVGDMDNYYLNLAVYKMEDFLKSTKDPYYGGPVVYGRPM